MSTEETKSKKRGFFSKLLFQEETATDESTSAETKVEADIKVSNTGVQNAGINEALSIPTTGDGVFDKKFGEALQQTIAENNIPGIDFFEFNQALKSMTSAGLNESIAFQTIFTTLKVSDPSLTKEKLLSSIDHYVGVLKKEEQEFKSEMQLKTEQEVISRRNKVTQLNSENQELVQKIQEIQQKITGNQEESIKLNGEASNAEAVIGQTHKNFITTLAYLTSGLEADKLRIGQLIKD